LQRKISGEANPTTASSQEKGAEGLPGKGNARRLLIVTDGVFSMEGDIAPLPEIVEIAEEYGAITMVDDAHGEGVLGRGGRGIVDFYNLHGRVDVESGTLSKAFGVVGGYIAGSKRLTDYLVQRGRPFLFSSAVTAADVAACIAAVEILMASDALVNQLLSNTAFFQEQMRVSGFNLGQTKTPITPIMIGDARTAKDFSRRLFEEGIFAQAIGFPTVPPGKARIRVMVSAVHSRDDLAHAVELFTRVGKSLGVV
ncbi:MAG: aminotransferase class I/II-fold pyridoxal phosphate-dependent enzyme, partial [Planctomycetes bacterium]|nr:aminotransferase class I/II-fold pyridoxal phosphate-dependent enzyme [Planctomycetota bacterium]